MQITPPVEDRTVIRPLDSTFAAAGVLLIEVFMIGWQFCADSAMKKLGIVKVKSPDRLKAPKREVEEIGAREGCIFFQKMLAPCE